MAFELYKKSRSYGGEEEVTITKMGVLVLSPLLFEHHFKGKGYAQLFFDEAKRAVGIRPLVKKEEFAYKISPSKNRRFASISGSAFLKTYGVLHPKSYRYPARFENEMVVFSVSKEDQP